MDISVFDRTMEDLIKDKLEELEKYFEADVVFYYGEIVSMVVKIFRDILEKIKIDSPAKGGRLVLFLNTPGGSVETVEKLVNITRHHYSEVFFVVPDAAMSAGTIFCMSGNKIYMDYSSSLGPIDPQVYNGKTWVPASGYLDKVNQMIGKDETGELTNAEFMMLQKLDLAELSRYEQAKNLTVTLLKEWLVRYKFEDWVQHQTTNPGQSVTLEEKQQRAEEIAKMLGDNALWHSHGRAINVSTLQSKLKLRIEDYSQDQNLRSLIRGYNDLLVEYIRREEVRLFLHSRLGF